VNPETGPVREVVAQFESFVCVIPNRGVVQPQEGSPPALLRGRDTSLRLKNGSARDDAARKGVKLSHCRTRLSLARRDGNRYNNRFYSNHPETSV